MLSENYIIFYANDVKGVIRIQLFKMHQNLELHTSLVLESFLVSNQLNSYMLFCFVVEAFDGLSERTFAQEFLNFETISDMVSKDYFIVASFIIIAKVIGMKR